MGDAWRETVVAIITEFGRTAHINGTDGTDHGTGTLPFSPEAHCWADAWSPTAGTEARPAP